MRQISLSSGPVDWSVRVPSERLVAECQAAPRPVVENVGEAVRRALASPIGFPPLEKAIYPEDRVVIAVDGSPAAFRPVLRPIIEVAVQRGAKESDITILAPYRARRQTNVLGDFPVRVEYHNPNDRHALCYLASTEEGERIYLNRKVVDADVLITVGSVRFDPVLGYRGTSSAVFPALSSIESYERFVSSFTGRSVGHHPDWARKYVDQVGWLLGVQFSVQVVQSPTGDVIGVFAGEATKVQEEAQRLLDETLSFEIPRRADLVIATVARGFRQSLAEVARAIYAAHGVVRKGGRIVVLSAAEVAEGPGIEQIRRAEEAADVLKYLRESTPPDAVTTFMHATACRDAHVFLHSRLADSIVEDLFMYPLHHAHQVQRLVDEAQQCIVLHGANTLRVRLKR